MADSKPPKNIVNLIESWAKTVKPIDGGGTVQKNAWPDAWVYISVVALVAEGVALGLAVSGGPFLVALGFALAGLVMALVGVALRQRSWRMP